MAILICDHCGNYTCNYDTTNAIMWCGPCITADYRLIDEHQLIHNAGDDLHFIWINAKSIQLLKTVPKRKAPINVPLPTTIVGKPFDSEKKPCSRAYYGMLDCTCGKCPPKRHPINTNPFRYGF